MRRKGLYITLFILLLALAAVKNRNLFNLEQVEPGQTSGGYREEWFPFISGEVNEKKAALVVDGKEVNTGKTQVFMTEEGTFMIPASVLTEAFSCAAHFYGDSVLALQKGEIRAETEPVRIGDVACVPAKTIEELFSYETDWDAEACRLTMTSVGEQDILPAAYDYRKVGRAPGVKNQGTLGTCWSFASLMALESRLTPEEKLDFSEDHMSRMNSFRRNQNDGGEYTMSMAYLLAWQGPVPEAKDPYGDGFSPSGLSPVKHVQTIQILPERDDEAIKKAVFFYGGVQSSLYTSMVTGQRDSRYYNKETGAYCYTGERKPNHDIVIIGWDDNYSRDNFIRVPEGDGAFICANSWGGEFGDEGYFYVSYYDSNIGIHNVLYRRVDEPDNYDAIYQTDLCGWAGQLGYGRENAYFANVYTAEDEEELCAAGFYATGGDTSYEIYTVADAEGTGSFTKRVLAATGEAEYAGYYTVDFDKPVRLKKGQRFAVIVSITTPGSVHPVAIEYDAPDKDTKVDLTDGEGYISFRGSSWERAEEKQNCNVCLKAYTRKVEKDGE